jgi:signal transduction histidine kinase
MDEAAARKPEQGVQAFLAGGGEMGELCRTHDWTRTPLGPVEDWPQSLRSAVSICLGSRFPIVIYWGPDCVLLYNDAYAEILGKKHPWAFGRPCREVWSEIWGVIAPMLEGVMATGEATWSDDQLLYLERRGYPEECYFSFSFSPVRGAEGEVDGIFTAVIETTRRVLGERRLRTLRDLAACSSAAKTEDETWQTFVAPLRGNPQDIPFALLYRIGPGRTVHLAAAAGVEGGSAAAPAAIDLSAGESAAWPIARVARSGTAEVLENALVLPIVRPGSSAYGYMVAGNDAGRAIDADCRDFLALVADHIAMGIGNARAYEEERKRAEALAEIDRAKTAFFGNVSHEFRTPLTLMLGPVEDLLQKDEVTGEDRAGLEVVRRNGERLLKLVNTLLDFSRIEAGRAQASYELTDLAALTADLASNFRSACERAGLRLTVDCAAKEPAYVDREMWEKVVLNLLSNAFKFTLAGEIAVSLSETDGHFLLAVRDTGSGIPTAEVPRMFERFHRIEGARGRSHEGSGIGLALVQELVKLHGGTIEVQSALGKGSTFTVSVPKGHAHLAQERIKAGRAGTSTALRAGAYVEEALSWLPGMQNRVESGKTGQRVLLADDNADLREYAQRLLAGHYEVDAVADGEAALAAARRRRPDLVISDVMMPGLDGFGLIRELHADEKLRDVPVMLLSARAGEEARLEGLGRGADDYLVKPFSARELLVRAGALLQSADRVREKQTALREADRRKDEFLATLSHELRNPLGAIHNAVELLGIAEREPGVARQARGILERQVGHMVRLVDDLLELSRVSRGNIVLQRRTTELADIVASALETARRKLDAGGHEVRIELPDEPVMLDADPVRIAQVLANLLDNAAKYTPGGGLIRMTARHDARQVTISVHDNGRGIAPEMLPRVFDLFVQAGSLTGEGQDGLGIGLSLARTLTQMHGGSIEARSNGPGEGSEFIVRLPTSDSAGPLPASALDTSDTGEVADACAARVLVVDDNVDAADSLGMMLRHMGHEARVVYDGRSALRAADERAPDIVLLDVNLPDMDGYAVAGCLRSDSRLLATSIVAVTGRGQEVDRQRTRDAGFHGHLTKPVTSEALRALMARCQPAGPGPGHVV